MAESLRRSLPFKLRTGDFFDFARAVVRTLGLPWPDEVRAKRKRTCGNADTPDAVDSTWEHGGVRIVLGETSDHDHPPMEAADRFASACLLGLPGTTSLRATATGNGAWFEILELYGDEPVVDRVLDAVATTLTELARERSYVSEGLLYPDTWKERARASRVGDFVRSGSVLRTERWVVEDYEDGWFAVEPGGELAMDRPGISLTPIGPLPRALEDTTLSLSRAYCGMPPPSLEVLVPLLLGEPLPAAPEEVFTPECEVTAWKGTKRRFRSGPRLFLDRHALASRSDDKIALTIRIHSERGGPWCVLFEGEYTPNGWAKAKVKIIGDTASRDAVEARLSTWIQSQGWSLDHRR
jgi:hypothetical protein